VKGRLEGRVALITGASRGMGAAEARLFAAEGARVLLADILDADGECLAAEIGAAYQHLDVTREDDWRAAVETAERRFGRLDVLVNNAGISGAGGAYDTTLADWSRMIAVNQTGVFLGVHHAAPALRRAGGGSIVNVSSVAGLVGIPGASLAYAASKGAVRLLSKSAALDLAADRIRVNSVHPGWIATAMTAQTGERARFLAEHTPLGRSADPLEVAYGVLFLACEESSFVTGSELVIDGGWTAR
jgi:NAD(P)-dependent dehydrogenase (short-subunit alcohol dehydrogenase family)